MKNQKPHKAPKITLPAKENIYQAFEFMCQHQSTNYYKYACTDSLFKTSVFSNPGILTYTCKCTPIIPSLRLCVLFSLVHAVACGHKCQTVSCSEKELLQFLCPTTLHLHLPIPPVMFD